MVCRYNTKHKMRVKVTETINNQWRVLWSDNGGLRGGYKDFNTNEQAIHYATKLTTNETK